MLRQIRFAFLALALPLALSAITGTAQAQYGGLIITEIASQPTPDEMVEITNTSTTAMNIGGVILSDEDNNNTEGAIEFPTGTMIAPNEVILVAVNTSATEPSWLDTLPSGSIRVFYEPSRNASGWTPAHGNALTSMIDDTVTSGGTSGSISLTGSDGVALYKPSVTFGSGAGPTPVTGTIDGLNWPGASAGPFNPINPSGLLDTGATAAGTAEAAAGNGFTRTSLGANTASNLFFTEQPLSPGVFTAPSGADNPDIGIAPSALQLTAVDKVTTITAHVVIANGGASAALNVTGATITGPGAAHFSVQLPLPTGIAAGTTASLTVLFYPSKGTGVSTATLSVVSNDQGGDIPTVNLTGSASSLAGKVIINEWAQSSGDWVELLVTQTADLRGMWVCDSGGPDASNGLEFSSTNDYWSSVPAGTLITFFDAGTLLTEDFDNSDYSITINGTTFSDASLFDPVNNHFKAYSGSTAGDNPRIFDKNRVLIHDWDQNNDTAFTGALRASSTGQADEYTSTSAAGVSNPANWTLVGTGGTPGQPNGGANTTWIQSLRNGLRGKVIINEWGQGSAGDYVELLVTQTADLRGMWICDEGGPDASNGLELSTTNAFWSAVPAGTLITLYANAAAPAEDNNPADYTLVFNTSPLTDPTLWDATNKNFKAYGSTATDNPRIFDKNQVLIHDWDQGNLPSFTTNTLRATLAGNSDRYNGDTADADALANPANWTLVVGSGTPDAPNGGANTTWINGLRGGGIPDPLIAVAPLTLNFGTIDAAANTSATLTITNNGATQNLHVSGAALSGTSPSKFTVLTGLPLDVAAGSSATLRVKFTPAGTTGTLTAKLAIGSNDSSNPVTTVTLTGSASTAATSTGLHGKVIINEWAQEGTGDWVEILVTQTTNLGGLWVCDSGGPDALNGLELSTTDPLWKNVPAGTLITFYDTGTTPAEDLNVSDYNLVIIADPLLHPNLFDATNNHFKAYSGSTPTDNPRLFDADLTLIHDWDQNNNAAFTGSLRATISGDTDVYTGNTVAGVSDPANWTLIQGDTGTPAQPNGGNNTTWINQLRAGTPPPHINAAHDWMLFN